MNEFGMKLKFGTHMKEGPEIWLISELFILHETNTMSFLKGEGGKKRRKKKRKQNLNANFGAKMIDQSKGACPLPNKNFKVYEVQQTLQPALAPDNSPCRNEICLQV